MRSFNHWQIAWKKANEATFQMISNPPYGWCADPFLVEYRGELYLFAEIFLYKTERNGVIGYCKYTNNGWGEWTVSMDKHWHLSYPNVWVENGRLYMCPESYQSEEVAIYELEKLPDKWKKTRILVNNVTYCDSTFLHYDNKDYLITYERGITGSSIGRGLLYEITESGLKKKQVFSENKEGNRCGGKIIKKGAKLIRVAQNCNGEYGKGLIFYEIDDLYPVYKEHEIRRITSEEIPVSAHRNYIGVHTYNACEGIEVIDLKYKAFSLSEYIARQRVQKVFVNKYR